VGWGRERLRRISLALGGASRVKSNSILLNSDRPAGGGIFLLKKNKILLPKKLLGAIILLGSTKFDEMVGKECIDS